MKPTLPNILLCTLHDAGRQFGCYGHPTVVTPHVDRLAGEGVILRNAFCASAKCSPSRGALLTGRWPQSNGLYYLCHPPFDWHFHQGERTLTQILADHGYHCVLHGFQHEHPHQSPERLGHHEFYNHEHLAPTWQVPPCDVIAEGAARWLRQQSALPEGGDRKPFFLQLGFFETHRPYHWGGAEPDASLGVELPSWIEPTPELENDMAALQGMLRKADAAFGVVLDALEAGGLAEDTLVIFTVDHGLDLPGAKGTCYEPGLETALVLRWPKGGVKGGRKVADMVSNVDLLPSLIELLGLPQQPGVQGISFAQALRGVPNPAKRTLLPGMIEEGERRSIRDERWKLIRNFTQLHEVLRPVRLKPVKDLYLSGGSTETCVHHNLPLVEFYDLTNDPDELRNLADDPACTPERQRLDAALWQWMESVNDPVLALPHIPRWRQNLADYLNWKNHHA